MEGHGLQSRRNRVFGQRRIYVRLTLTSYCRVHVTFIDKEGLESTFAVAEGDNLLDIAQSEDIDMEGMFSSSCLLYIGEKNC